MCGCARFVARHIDTCVVPGTFTCATKCAMARSHMCHMFFSFILTPDRTSWEGLSPVKMFPSFGNMPTDLFRFQTVAGKSAIVQSAKRLQVSPKDAYERPHARERFADEEGTAGRGQPAVLTQSSSASICCKQCPGRREPRSEAFAGGHAIFSRRDTCRTRASNQEVATRLSVSIRCILSPCPHTGMTAVLRMLVEPTSKCEVITF